MPLRFPAVTIALITCLFSNSLFAQVDKPGRTGTKSEVNAWLEEEMNNPLGKMKSCIMIKSMIGPDSKASYLTPDGLYIVKEGVLLGDMPEECLE